MSMLSLTDALSGFNRFQSAFTSHILLYHSTFRRVPEALEQNLHNVAPDVLFEHVKWLQKYFDIVELDQLFDDNVTLAGKVAITFDDAYQSVFEEALPVIQSLDVPCTIFINGISLAGKPFWRDKIRYLINQSLVEDFLKFCPVFAEAHDLTIDNFYIMTKQVPTNSAALDTIIDQYVAHMGIQLEALAYCVSSQDMLLDHPLISYGNHTYNHYVLSSLSDEQQEKEIGDNHHLLADLQLKLSRVFAIPFGGDKDFNGVTLRLLKKYGYTGFLYSKESLNWSRLSTSQKVDGLFFMDRYMVRSIR